MLKTKSWGPRARTPRLATWWLCQPSPCTGLRSPPGPRPAFPSLRTAGTRLTPGLPDEVSSTPPLGLGACLQPSPREPGRGLR